MSRQTPTPETIFAQAIEIADPEERAAFLSQACGNDAQLHDEVEKLVRDYFRAGGFLQQPAARLVATTDEPAARERPGTVIGPYKLLEQIGEGGMGAVWMAQQTAPVKRLVAVKLIKAGMDSKQVIARFEAERQALALMDHANIARVLDAGTTDAGRPYFVMDLVKGVPITKYCDDHHLTPRQRLELFVPVCQAVQHAHQKGIIHRDLKPSNVLVALYDGKPVPKVIDFGVAKAAGHALTDKTLVTGFGNIVGTLEYMSPEQAEINQLDIDTRSDIYSLGVLLYELLTGSPPFTKKDLEKAGMLEMLRVIREQEPSKPSTKLSTAEGLPTLAANRGTEPAKLTKLVRGELDWIVMKALEKDRSRRYETASAFAADVQRYLNDEPILACPPSVWYRFRKFARRNRSRVVAAGVLGFALLVAVAAIGWAVRDRAARQAKFAIDLELALDRVDLFQSQGQRAKAQAAFEQAQALAREAPSDTARDVRLAVLKERLDAEERDQVFQARFEDIRLRLQSRVDIESSRFTPETVLPEIREALDQYGMAIGVAAPAEAAAYIGDRPEAVRRDLIAALYECLGRTPKGDAQRQWLVAVLSAVDNDAWRARMREAAADHDWKALEQLAREADVRKQPTNILIVLATSLPASARSTRLELLRRTQRAHPADLWTNLYLADELTETGQPAAAVRYLTAALVLRPYNPGIYVNRGIALERAGELDAAIADHKQALALEPRYAVAHNALGVALMDKGALDEAIAEYREAIRLKKDYWQAHDDLGIALKLKGKLVEAIAEHRIAIQINKDTPNPHVNLSNALRANGRLDEAIAELEKAVHLKPDFAEAHSALGSLLIHKGRIDEALAECREAIRLKNDDPEAHTHLGNALHAKGQLDEAIAEHHKALRLKRDFPEAHANLAVALSEKGRLDDAVPEYREAIRLKKDFPIAHHGLANALHNQRRLDEAIAEYREAIRLKKDFWEAHDNLGIALADKGELDEAIAEHREALRINKDALNPHYNLGTLLYGQGRLDEAIAEYHEAIRINKEYAQAYCNLGIALRDQGRFAEALAALRRGDELGSRKPGWPYHSKRWVRDCELLIEFDRKLPAILSGKQQPADAERYALGQLCQMPYQKRYAAAARFYAAAFAADPRLAEDLAHNRRYNAACAAVLAGCGQGQDASGLDEKERARLRGQALAWLRADLEAWGGRLEKQPQKSAPVLTKVLQHWLTDADFAGVHGPAALGKLPEAERRQWQQLWSDVGDMLSRAKAKAVSTKNSDTK
jgi:tetratricopeptide (TPR) repeat protein/tRNA A-37 threonylcarbamoyl transferase component Bud32